MKTLIISFLGIVLGIIFVIFLIYLWFRMMLNKYGFKNKKLCQIYEEAKRQEKLNNKKPKQVSGMTSILKPKILEDFKDFQEEEFYSQTEKCIRTVLKSIEEKESSYLESDEYILIRDKIFFQIENLKDANISKHYGDINFHKHGIKSYENKNGIIKLVISSSLEYYYEESKNLKKIISTEEKKQTRYLTTFVYIYDVKKAGFDMRVLGLTCPSCGGPIESLEKKTCPYCKSGIHFQIASLVKCFKIIDVKEDK